MIALTARRRFLSGQCLCCKRKLVWVRASAFKMEQWSQLNNSRQVGTMTPRAVAANAGGTVSAGLNAIKMRPRT